MIDAVLRIIDRLIQLRQYQSDRLKKQFEFIVQPIMEDLERIQSDYLQMFLEVRVLLADGRATSKDAADLLDARRTLFEPVRQKLMAGFPELDASGFSPPLQKFGKAVLNFFPLGDLYTAGGTSATTLIRELRRLGTERRSFQADLRYFVVEHLADTATHTMWPHKSACRFKGRREECGLPRQSASATCPVEGSL
jgi:hypothetical protein